MLTSAIIGYLNKGNHNIATRNNLSNICRIVLSKSQSGDNHTFREDKRTGSGQNYMQECSENSIVLYMLRMTSKKRPLTAGLRNAPVEYISTASL